MWNNLLKGVKPMQEEEGQPTSAPAEMTLPKPVVPIAPKPAMPATPRAPAAPGAHPNLMSWAKAAALKKLRGY